MRCGIVALGLSGIVARSLSDDKLRLSIYRQEVSLEIFADWTKNEQLNAGKENPVQKNDQAASGFGFEQHQVLQTGRLPVRVLTIGRLP
jgi:hypothetical protein